MTAAAQQIQGTTLLREREEKNTGKIEDKSAGWVYNLYSPEIAYVATEVEKIDFISMRFLLS